MNTQIIRPPAFQRPSGKLYLGTDQLNLLSAATTLVLLDTVPAEYTDGIEDTVNHRITPRVAGWYSILGVITYKNVVAAKNYYSELRLNGTGALIAEFGFHSAQAASLTAIAHLPCHYMTNADFVELLAWHGAGVDTIDIDSVIARTFLSVQRVR